MRLVDNILLNSLLSNPCKSSSGVGRGFIGVPYRSESPSHIDSGWWVCADPHGGGGSVRKNGKCVLGGDYSQLLFTDWWKP